MLPTAKEPGTFLRSRKRDESVRSESWEGSDGGGKRTEGDVPSLSNEGDEMVSSRNQLENRDIFTDGISTDRIGTFVLESKGRTAVKGSRRGGRKLKPAKERKELASVSSFSSSCSLLFNSVELTKQSIQDAIRPLQFLLKVLQRAHDGEIEVLDLLQESGGEWFRSGLEKGENLQLGLFLIKKRVK